MPLDEIDLFPAEWYQSGDPHAAWRTLRAERPVWRQETPDGVPFWSVTRHRDVVAVLRDTARFSSEYSTMLTVLGDGDTARGKAIHLMDPPRHGDVRGSAIPALSMRAMRRHEDAIRKRVRELLATVVERGRCDFAEVMTVLPMVVSGAVLGIPEREWAEAAKWTVASMAPDDPAYTVGDPRSTLLEAHVFLFTMFSDLLDARRAEPADDLVSQLIAMQIDGRPATDEEVLVNCYAVIMGANPTIPQAAAQLVILMASRPDLWQRVRTEPALVGPVVEETLRWSSPVNHLLRRTTEEVRLGDETVPAGGLVVAWLGSANRDEEVFTDPFRFDPDRTSNPHVAFGVGAHRCVGNSTAQLGLQVLLEEMVATVGTIEIDGEVSHLRSNFLNGITRLPVATTGVPVGTG
jgi:cytochrome P450